MSICEGKNVDLEICGSLIACLKVNGLTTVRAAPWPTFCGARGARDQRVMIRDAWIGVECG